MDKPVACPKCSDRLVVFRLLYSKCDLCGEAKEIAAAQFRSWQDEARKRVTASFCQ